MAFAAGVPIAEYAIGPYSVEEYRVTQANTDSGGTFTTRMTKPIRATVHSETSSQNGGRVLAASVAARVVTVTTNNGGGSQAPTAMIVKVLGLP